MKKFDGHRILSTSLLIAAVLLGVAQFAMPARSSGGAWCSPYLDAPPEMGHSAYQFTTYGFPLPAVTVAEEDCFSDTSTSYEWFLPGAILDGLILGFILYAWFLYNRKYRKLKEVQEPQR